MSLRKVIDVGGTQLRGGAVTVREKALLKPGQFSWVQNLIPRHPGFEKRKGCRKYHATADSTNQVMTMYQFAKTRISESFLMAQMSDADVLYDATSVPTVGAGAFGSELFSGTASGHKPAHWTNLNDFLNYANCADQHKIWPGSTQYVDRFFCVFGTTNPTTIKGPFELGVMDYTKQVTNTDTTTYATLSSLDTAANGDCLLICTQTPATSFTFTLDSLNDNASVMSGYYWKNDSTWAAVSGLSDGTDVSGDTLKQSGTVTFTAPTDMIEHYINNRVGYWYMFVFSAALDASVTVTKCTYTGPVSSIRNMWDGVRIPSVEVMVEGSSTYESFGSGTVDLSSLASGKKIYIASAQPIEGIYIDVGDTPNTTAATAITSLKYWNGTAWTSVGTATDGTGGMANSGWIVFPRQSAVMPLQFESTGYTAYWYELIWDDAISSDVVIAVDTMPYYDVTDIGTVGQACTAWKERMCYSFGDKYTEYVYISPRNAPQTLNGTDFGIIEVGDGRPHKITAMVKFYNDLMVFQEEKGTAGGCITMIQGYNLPTFGKMVISTQLGTMSAKSVVVCENVYTATATAETLKTIAFFISRYGICYADGKTIGVISDDIQNYFDPTKSECIRRGYEDQHWIALDPVNHLLRIGLVSGSSATVPNVFPIYDLIDRCWYFDTPAQEFSCWVNVGGDTGSLPVIQLAGGVDDGFIYQTNYGTDDVSTAIDAYLDIEIPGSGFYMDLTRMMWQFKAQSAGDATITVYGNAISKATLTLSMTAEVTNQIMRRHLKNMNVIDQHLTIRCANSTAAQSIYPMSVGMEISVWEKR